MPYFGEPVGRVKIQTTSKNSQRYYTTKRLIRDLLSNTPNCYARESEFRGYLFIISLLVIGLKELLFSTNSLAKLLSDSSYGQFVIGQFNKPITFKIVIVRACSCFLCFWGLIAGRRRDSRRMFRSPLSVFQCKCFLSLHNFAIHLFSEIIIFMVKLVVFQFGL